MYNQTKIIGYLGGDPREVVTRKGEILAAFHIGFRHPQSKRCKLLWMDVVAYAELAEDCLKLLQKGMEVYIEGHLMKRRKYEGEGRFLELTQLVADYIVILHPNVPGRQRILSCLPSPNSLYYEAAA